MVFTMDDYCRMTPHGQKAITEWARRYVVAERCFGFELAADGPNAAAKFWIYDTDQYRSGMDEIPRHEEVAFNVDLPPVLEAQ